MFIDNGSGMFIAEIDTAVSADKAEPDAAFGTHCRDGKRRVFGTVNNDLFKAAASRFSVRLLKRSSAPVQISVTGSRIQCSGKQAGLLCSSS